MNKKNMILKRILCFLLTFVCLCCFAGCGKTEEETAAADSAKETTKEAEGTETITEETVPEETAAETFEIPTAADGSVIHPVVTIKMQDGGIIKAELYPEVAPNTVCNFISLIRKGFYNGSGFHRVISTFMIQGGSPNGLGNGGPGYTITGEFTGNGFQNDLKHTRGVLSMARSNSPNSAGSQFFIMHGDADWLDGQYAAFGMVTEGMDVVDRIADVKTDANDRPLEDVVIEEVTVDTFGAEYPEPQTY